MIKDFHTYLTMLAVVFLCWAVMFKNDVFAIIASLFIVVSAVFVTINAIKNYKKETDPKIGPFEHIAEITADRLDNVEIAFMDAIFKYASDLGYSPAVQTELDDKGVTHFFLCNASMADINSTDVQLEKLIEIFMIDNRIKKDSSDFKALVAKVTDMLDLYHKEHRK